MALQQLKSNMDGSMIVGADLWAMLFVMGRHISASKSLRKTPSRLRVARYVPQWMDPAKVSWVSTAPADAFIQSRRVSYPTNH